MQIPDNDFLAFTLAHPDQQAPFAQAFPGGMAYVEQVGVLRIVPEHSCADRVILSSGIHGNETAPMELLNELLRDILGGRLTPVVPLLFIIGHPQAAVAQTRFCEVNLNRLFQGAWQRYQGREVERAQQLEQQVARFFDDPQATGKKLHYDLHTAIRASAYETFAVHPYTSGKPYQDEQFGLYAAMGLEAVLLSHQPTTTFSYHSYATHGAEAATIELGKVRPFGANDLSQLQQMREVLTQMIRTGQLATKAYQETLKCFAVVDVLVKDAPDFELGVSNAVPNFTAFEQGEALAWSSQNRYIVKQTGDALVFPNTDIPVGQRAGLVVRQCDWDKVRSV
ncbi:succinylglutamate desuccinylase [Marinomonas ostreistagni]|uniref:succinylglutamate desuccinylase n=1 Tax=Marinomonas ostreistagni TaxID=359209 RepID=UPI001951ABCB|nr:succinylglutamate desuccinylase [Marinomonas ostreistagni]MBM6551569.1 succinylglutamate desuccinylase [Marinomonas ostreistagni]